MGVGDSSGDRESPRRAWNEDRGEQDESPEGTATSPGCRDPPERASNPGHLED